MATKFLQNTEPDTKDLIACVSGLSYAGIILVTTNKFLFNYRGLMFVNILGGYLIGMCFPTIVDYLIPNPLISTPDDGHALFIGVVGAGSYLFGSIWYDWITRPANRITPYEDCGCSYCPANDNLKTD